MKKTYNINISGKIFTIDEDAYNMLNDYLDTLEHAFKGFDESSEITADIECRISDLLTETLENGNLHVVTIDHVGQIISRIGTPNEILETDEEIQSEEPEPQSEENQQNRRENSGSVPSPIPPMNIKKRLFRDPQNSMLGGVCSGIGAYLNIDPTWIRLFFLALFFLSYTSIFLIYIILWIVLPVAKTPLERMQMCGEVPTFENIGRNVKSFFNTDESVTDEPKSKGWKRVAEVITNIAGAVAKVFLIILSLIAIPAVIILALAFVGVLCALILFATSSFTLWDSPVSYNETILGLLCALGFVIVAGIPLTMLAISFIWNTQSKPGPMLSNKWKTSLVITWIAGILLFGISAGVLNSKDTVNEFIEMRRELNEAKQQLKEAHEIINDANNNIEEATISVKDAGNTVSEIKVVKQLPADSVKH